MSEGGYTPQSLPDRLRHAASVRGARPVVGDFARWGASALAGLPWTLLNSRGGFDLQGERYAYLYHRYKLTWLTERAVEVPVIQAVVDRHAGARVLEVGNVLSHYRGQSHLVVDKYERVPGVLNRDVLELGELGEFDLIVAISTLEHAGWDESPREPDKARTAVLALRAMLAPGGCLVFTVPIGYNPAFDSALRDGSIGLSHRAALRRAGPGANWREVAPDEVFSAHYDFLLYRARGVLFASVQR